MTLTARPFRLAFPLATIATLVVLLTVLVATPSAFAQPGTPAPATPGADAGPEFVIRPADGVDGDFFTVEAEAGTTNELTAVLGNADDEPLSLRTYANDAVPIINGGFAIADEDTPAIGTATWIDYPAETFDFAPGEGVERRFTVTIPADTAPGQYIAGVALQTAEPLEVEGTSLFNQIIRKSVAVFIIVPGPESPAFSLGEPVLITGEGAPRIDIPVENTGNVLVRPQGDIILRNDAGETVVNAPVAMGSVYAGTATLLSVPLVTALPDGDYTLAATFTDPESGITDTVEGQTLTIVAPDDTPVQYALDGTITLAPDLAAPVYADIAVTITNNGEPVDNAAVLVDAMRDGELVETFTLVPALALPQGATEVNQRYVPPTGFEEGEWSFVVRLAIVNGGAETTVATLDTIEPVQVGN
jgi:hypothetical protein